MEFTPTQPPKRRGRPPVYDWDTLVNAVVEAGVGQGITFPRGTEKQVEADKAVFSSQVSSFRGSFRDEAAKRDVNVRTLIVGDTENPDGIWVGLKADDDESDDEAGDE